MATIPPQMADIPPQMADLNARSWADFNLPSQIAQLPIQNSLEYRDSGPSRSTQRDFLTARPRRRHPLPKRKSRELTAFFFTNKIWNEIVWRRQRRQGVDDNDETRTMQKSSAFFDGANPGRTTPPTPEGHRPASRGHPQTPNL